MAGRLLALAATAAMLAGCTESPAEGDRAGSRSEAPDAPPTSTPSPSERKPSETLVVVGHATRPQLDLTRAQARALTSGPVARWHGLRVVRDLPARRALDAVERDPRTLAVVPLEAVGP